jgi:hypothetical protein
MAPFNPTQIASSARILMCWLYVLKNSWNVSVVARIEQM